MKRLHDANASAVFSRREVLKTALYGALAAAAPVTSAFASGYPQRPIQYVSPYPPGGTNDLVARIASKRLAALLGTSIIVENRGGAGGTIGTGYVARANADGYTVLNASSGNLTSAPQVLGAPYRPLADFIPVGFLGNIRFVFASHPSLKVNTLHELIAYAKAHPGKVNYGTAGIGTGGHLAGEYLKLRTGIDIVHVPYRGSAPALTDAVAGAVQLVIDPLATEYVRSGNLRGLAFAGATDAADLPGVPSIDVAGVPHWEVTNFYLATVPVATPPAIVDALSAAFAKLAGDPSVVASMKPLGVELKPLDRNQTFALLKAETAVNNRIIAAAHIPTAKAAA
ncbi:MAG: Bug family tripartite tricarboxylate transporter substrate binding protein [Janthinobacterium lividum]